MRESSPPEAVSAIGANGRPGFGRMRNVTSSASGRPGRRAPGARPETRPLPAERGELLGDGARRAVRVGLACRASSAASAVMCDSAALPPSAAASPGSPPPAASPSSRAAAAASSRSSSYDAAAKRRLRSAIACRSLLDALELSRPGVDRRDEAMEIASPARRAVPQGRGAPRRLGELGREALERCERTLRSRGERDGRAFALVGGDRRGGCVRRFCELLDMPQPFAPAEQLVLVAAAIPSVASTSACSSASRNATASASRVNSS